MCPAVRGLLKRAACSAHWDVALTAPHIGFSLQDAAFASSGGVAAHGGAEGARYPHALLRWQVYKIKPSSNPLLAHPDVALIMRDIYFSLSQCGVSVEWLRGADGASQGGVGAA